MVTNCYENEVSHRHPRSPNRIASAPSTGGSTRHTRTELLEWSCDPCMRVFTNMLEDDRTAPLRAAGVRTSLIGSASWAGTTRREVVLDDRKATIQRPRGQPTRSRCQRQTMATTDPQSRPRRKDSFGRCGHLRVRAELGASSALRWRAATRHSLDKPTAGGAPC